MDQSSPETPCRRRKPDSTRFKTNHRRGQVYSKRMNMAQLSNLGESRTVQLQHSCTGDFHAPVHFYPRSPQRPEARAFPPSPSPRATQDGSLVAQEPRVDPRGGRPLGWRFASERPTVSRRIRRRRLGAHSFALLAWQSQRTPRPPRRPGGPLPGAPAAFRARSPSDDRTADRHPPGPDPSARFFKNTLGLKWRKVGTIPAKADPEQQAAFLKTKLQPRLRQA